MRWVLIKAVHYRGKYDLALSTVLVLCEDEQADCPLVRYNPCPTTIRAKMGFLGQAKNPVATRVTWPMRPRGCSANAAPRMGGLGQPNEAVTMLSIALRCIALPGVGWFCMVLHAIALRCIP